MTNSRSNNYIGLKEAASLVGVTTTTLRNWDRKGRLKAVRHPVNKYRMYRLEDVLALRGEIGVFPEMLPSVESLRLGEGSRLSTSDLRRLVSSLHRILRDSEGGSSLIERFDELTKLLYCKIHDELLEAEGAQPVFSVAKGEGEQEVARRLRAFFTQLVRRRPELFPDRFSEIKLSDDASARLVEALAPTRLSGGTEDLKGLAYEELIRNTFEKGDNQQFFTPRTVVEFMVEMLGEPLSHATMVCDPACGTGGFLLSVHRWCQRHSTAEPPLLVGLEVDDRLAWVTGMNLDLHRAVRFEVKHLPGTGSLGSDSRPMFGTVDVIITNPPFGSDFSSTEALRDFQLGSGRTARRRGVLFIERCLDLVKAGGMVGIIIDDGVLNGPSNTDTRELVLQRSHPIAIVSLPDTTFMPYATVKASVLFLKKRTGGERTESGDTFFGDAEVVGRKPNGDPLYRVNRATRKLELDSDLPRIIELWRGGSSSHDASDTHGYWSELPALADAPFKKDGVRLDLAFHHPARHEAEAALTGSPFPLMTIGELCDDRNELILPLQELQEEDITWVGLANIEAHTGIVTPSVINASSLKSAVKRFEAGDILWARMRPELRKVCLVPDDMEVGYASAECVVLTPKLGDDGEALIVPELLALLLRSDLVYGQIVHLVTGIGRPRLTKSAALDIRLPVPPRSVQLQLMDYYRGIQTQAEELQRQSERAREQALGLMTEAEMQLARRILRTQ
ncbi:MAG: N-6 DNA methylase [Gemmatimonadales bacterium]